MDDEEHSDEADEGEERIVRVAATDRRRRVFMVDVRPCGVFFELEVHGEPKPGTFRRLKISFKSTCILRKRKIVSWDGVVIASKSLHK